MFSEHRDMAAAKAFFQSAKTVTDVIPDRVTTDGHDSYPRAIRTKLGEGVKHRTGTVNLSSMQLRETRSVDWRPATGMITRPSPHQ